MKIINSILATATVVVSFPFLLVVVLMIDSYGSVKKTLEFYINLIKECW